MRTEKRRGTLQKQAVGLLTVVTSLLLSLVSGGNANAQREAGRPNIIIILADDMGFSDPGCYGGEIKTPNLDRLASGGIRFSQFYNCAVCGPSRAALMTGQYARRVGVTRWTGVLNKQCVTLFELLKRAGYATCAVGRPDMITADNWMNPSNISKYVDHYLLAFDDTGPGNYFKAVRDVQFYRDGKRCSDSMDRPYSTDYITDFAVKFIRKTNAQKPFFLYLSEFAPHWPLQAKPEDIARYRPLYKKLGWDAARAQRLQRLINEGIVSRGTKLSPRDPVTVAWKNVESQDWEAERMATYAAQIDCLDQGVGRLMKALEFRGMDKNTLIFFLSDNGSSAQIWPTSLDKPGQTWRYDGTPTKVGNLPGVQPGPADNFVTAGPAWANVSNTPFRGAKDDDYEGGIATPLIVWWPGTVKEKGTITPVLTHITDIAATCLDAAGVIYPRAFHGREVLPMTGLTLLPVLRGDDQVGHKVLCWSTYGARAVREGSWKLVAAKGGSWELYDLSHDRTELNNLATQHPERVKNMARLFQDWLKDNP